MKTIATEITINAKPEAVWTTLIDFENHKQWNPFIQSIQGKPAIGETLKIFIQPPGAKGMTFTPTITMLNANEELRWEGKLGINGIFDGEHYFQLKPIAQEQTHLIHGEKFKGVLVPFMDGVLTKTQKGLELMNHALKEKVERKKS